MKNCRSNNSEYDEGYLNLANAIINQAIMDLKYAVEKRREGKETLKSKWLMSDALHFFNSDYFSLLTNVDPKTILKEVIADENRV